MSNKGLLALSFVLCTTNSWASSLCRTGEIESFSCRIKSKTVSVCAAKNDQLIYRYGKLGAIELTLVSPVHFSATSYSGGGEGHLTFKNNAYKYVIYSGIMNGEWIDEELGKREKIEVAGVYVIKDDDVLADLKCTGSDDDKAIRYLPPHEREEFMYY
ncbi:hypothetical protein AB733_03140 [Photobacterium swingsii]|uniref:Uncharacterized protein n=1 Tax=Photobacterium swingsii TaxID=680026 RepID=A0A0J8VEB7_9GAMM|nr:hypothetical protein [Photobacterium swingsii]KMV31788.1 hypothetical protein AB733_03140 [Photobacterium swingsii]PSW25404.1 hypothetical protein C9I94_07060 [Photobacterium swingsii]